MIYTNLKKNSGSILFVNYDITDKIKSDLVNNGFKKILTSKKMKVTSENSPLDISRYVPNYIKLVVYN